MNIEYWIYLFKDSKGNTDYSLIENQDDYIYLNGLVDSEGVEVSEEIKAWDAEDFLERKKIDVKVIKKSRSFESYWIQ